MGVSVEVHRVGIAEQLVMCCEFLVVRIKKKAD